MKTCKSLIALVVVVAGVAVGQAPPASDATLTVKTIAGQTAKFGPKDLAALPTVHVSTTGHDGTEHEYAGVSLRDLLDHVGVTMGDGLRGKEMADYLVAEATDGYRVVFSLAELDPAFTGTPVIVAQNVDGHPLQPQDGPLRLVVPGDKRQARWVRMLTSISVIQAQ